MMKRCESGHYFDPDKHSSCPYCGVDLDAPPTDRKRGQDLTRGQKETVRLGQSSRRPDPEPAPQDDDVVTVAYRGPKGFDPVVGWLVCVKGAEKGRDYRIRRGRNRIGRDKQMDIVVRGDHAISRIKEAILTFDDRTSRFLIHEGEGRGLLYHNGEQVVAAAELAPWDLVEMGKSTFCFVPLCGERFQWTVDD